MRKVIGSVVVMSGLVAAILVMGPSCKAEEHSKEPAARIEVAERATPIQVEPRPARVRVHIQRHRQKIFATPNYPAICPKPFCEGDQLEWEIVGGLEPGETLVIRDADVSNRCFPDTIPVMIEPPFDGAVSGEPDESCEQNPYGHLWPYVLELYMEGNPDPIADSDPGAIIHP